MLSVCLCIWVLVMSNFPVLSPRRRGFWMTAAGKAAARALKRGLRVWLGACWLQAAVGRWLWLLQTSLRLCTPTLEVRAPAKEVQVAPLQASPLALVLRAVLLQRERIALQLAAQHLRVGQPLRLHARPQPLPLQPLCCQVPVCLSAWKRKAAIGHRSCRRQYLESSLLPAAAADGLHRALRLALRVRMRQLRLLQAWAQGYPVRLTLKTRQTQLPSPLQQQGCHQLRRRSRHRCCLLRW